MDDSINDENINKFVIKLENTAHDAFLTFS